MQFAWRPFSQEGSPPEAAVVTSAGGLLHGGLGGVLRDFLATTTAAACCAWSADGSALAYAAEDVVTVQRVTPAAAFSLRIESQVHKNVFCRLAIDTPRCHVFWDHAPRSSDCCCRRLCSWMPTLLLTPWHGLARAPSWSLAHCIHGISQERRWCTRHPLLCHTVQHLPPPRAVQRHAHGCC